MGKIITLTESRLREIIRETIEEGLIMTYPSETLKKYLIRKLGIGKYSHEFIQIGDNEVITIFILKDTGFPNKDKIEKIMTLGGYNLSYEGEIQRGMDIGRGFNIYDVTQLQYEPKFNKVIKPSWKYLYHVTPTWKVDKIMKMGLTPHEQDGYFKYPNRVYLFTPNVNMEEIEWYAASSYVLSQQKKKGEVCHQPQDTEKAC